MKWARQYHDRVQATQEFVKGFASQDSQLISWLNQLETQEEKILWTILSGCLHQQITHSHLVRFLVCLQKDFTELSLANLPAPKESSIVKVIEKSLPKSAWPLAPHVPGIIWSACAYFRKQIQSNSELWLQKTRLEQWRSLGSIYFIGKTNPVRPKALLILDRIRLSYPYGIHLVCNDGDAQDKAWPLSVPAGAQRWMKSIGPGRMTWFTGVSDKERLHIYQELYKGIGHDHPASVPHGLQFYVEPEGRNLECLKRWESCKNCPLEKWCPSKRIL